MSGCSSVAEFYRGCDVLVSGATGFLGKVLVEKLLRSCRQVRTVYLLVRPKRGLTTNERLKSLMQQEVFSRLHEENPDANKKVVAIEGDLADDEFSLSKHDEALIRKVSVVFHCAATVKFNEEMKYAVKINVRGTKRMLDLACSMDNLKAFVHVSTAYCNSDRLLIEEKLYPFRGPQFFWRHLVEAAEKMTEYELNALTPKLMGNLPNSYTFTKQVAESLVYDYKDKLPLLIYRPSVVNSAFYEPYPGWVDNYNGALGIFLGYYTGFTRLCYLRKDTRIDYIGVDYCVNGALAAAAKRGVQHAEEFPFYNSAGGEYYRVMSETVPHFLKTGREVPTAKAFWKTKFVLTNNFLWFQVNFIFFNVLPSYFLDLLLKWNGVNFSLLKICRKYMASMRLLGVFMMTSFIIKNENFLNLYDELSSEDKQTFNFDHEKAWTEYDIHVKNVVLGMKKYLLKDDMREESINKLKSRTKYYDLADAVGMALWYAFLAWIGWRLLYYVIVASDLSTLWYKIICIVK